MKDDYIFPDNWIISIDEKNRELLNDWRLEQKKFRNAIPTGYRNIYMDYSSTLYGYHPEGTKLITIEQFKKYVLKTEEDVLPIQEDFTRLIELLKDLI